MNQQIFRILTNRPIAPGVFELLLSGDTSAVTAPGQFVNLLLDGFSLRRPISVCDWTPDTLKLIYKIVGRGTAALSEYAPGKTLDLLTGLGNGYDLSKSGDTPLLVGGGAGVPPLYGLAKRLLTQNRRPAVILGFNTAAEIFYCDEFSALGVPVTLCTADGSAGRRGFVTAGMEDAAYSYVYACGPEPMLRAVCDASGTISGQYSFESRMGCGFGACMGCSRKTAGGYKRICREGPVLEKEEILW